MLTENQREVLENLAYFTEKFPDDWARPLDCGGFNGSFHGPCLYRLSKRGLCERKSYIIFNRRTHYYKANEATVAALEHPNA